MNKSKLAGIRKTKADGNYTIQNNTFTIESFLAVEYKIKIFTVLVLHLSKMSHFSVCVSVFCTGVLLVNLSGYLIEVTLSWDPVFSLLILVNTTGLLIFLIFGDARRVDVEHCSQLIVI